MVRDSATQSPLTAVAAVNAGPAWVMGSDGLLTTRDGGVLWFPLVGVAQARDMVFFDELNGVLLTDTTVQATSDGGGSWRILRQADANLFSAMSFVNANVGFVATANHIVLRTTDGGQTWTPLSLPLSSTGISRSLLALDFIDAQTGWIVASDGLSGRSIFKTGDGGVTWQEQFLFQGLTVQIEDIFALDANRIWLVGSENFEGVGEIIFASTNGGLTWNVQQSDGSGGLRAVHFVSPLEGWMVGRRIHHTVDGGITWTVQPTIMEGFNDVVFTNETTGFVVGENGVILTTVTGGEDALDPSVPVGPQFPVTPQNPGAPVEPQFPVSPVPGGVDALDPSVPVGPQFPASPVPSGEPLSPAAPFGPVPDGAFGPSPETPFGPQSPAAPFGQPPPPFAFGPLLP